MNRLGIRFILLMTITLSLFSCGGGAKETFEKSISEKLYTPFKPIRESEEVGTIISFDKNTKAEILVAKRETCLKKLDVPESQKAAFITSTIIEHSDSNISAAISEALKEKIDLSLFASSTTDRHVSMKLKSPQVTQVETIKVLKVIDSLDKNDRCYKALINPHNLIIVGVLKAEGVSFEFTDSSGKKIQLTADILSQLQVTPEIKSKSKNRSSLTVDHPIAIGYRALKYESLPGLFEDEKRFRNLTAKEIESIRNNIAGAGK